MNSDNLNSGETLYVFYATQLDNDTALYARDRQNGIRFKVWQCEDGYFEAELINKMKYSLANGGRTLEQLYDNIKHDFIDIWFNFAECDIEELTEDARDFRKFILNNFELDRCDG
jgi:hypothetical protein